jgi:[acyl-carrier-protein] S-malonyltransferase
MNSDLKSKIGNAALAFRGYNVKNLGRSREILLHDAYGPIVRGYLKEAGAVCADLIGKRVDLVKRVRLNRETQLRTYPEAVALIVAMELAQIKLLKEFHGVNSHDAKFAFGYSLGEITAVAHGGMLEMANVLQVPLAMAQDSIELAKDVTMGVLFSRGPALVEDEVARLCLRISAENRGVIAMSAVLSPNTFLLLGQGDTIDRFKNSMHDLLDKRVHLRVNPHHWPPLHCPITWQRSIPNRAALMLQTLPGGFVTPIPPVLSLVTGKTFYTDLNARDLLYRWVDHPQRLWDVIDHTLSSGIDTVLHVGPEPNLIPATFNRLSENVRQQVSGRSLGSISLRAVSGIVARPWLSSLMPSRTSLLRAPMIRHIALESWLLEQPVE